MFKQRTNEHMLTHTCARIHKIHSIRFHWNWSYFHTHAHKTITTIAHWKSNEKKLLFFFLVSLLHWHIPGIITIRKSVANARYLQSILLTKWYYWIQKCSKHSCWKRKSYRKRSNKSIDKNFTFKHILKYRIFIYKIRQIQIPSANLIWSFLKITLLKCSPNENLLGI